MASMRNKFIGMAFPLNTPSDGAPDISIGGIHRDAKYRIIIPSKLTSVLRPLFIGKPLLIEHESYHVGLIEHTWIENNEFLIAGSLSSDLSLMMAEAITQEAPCLSIEMYAKFSIDSIQGYATVREVTDIVGVAICGRGAFSRTWVRIL